MSTNSIPIRRKAQEDALYMCMACQHPCRGRCLSCSVPLRASASDGSVGCILNIAVLSLLNAAYCMDYAFA